MDGESTLLVPHEKPRFRGCLRKDYCSCIPARYVLAVMTCFGLTVVYGLRVNLSVAIVQMDNDTATIYNGSAKVSNPINHHKTIHQVMSSVGVFIAWPLDQCQQWIISSLRKAGLARWYTKPPTAACCHQSQLHSRYTNPSNLDSFASGNCNKLCVGVGTTLIGQKSKIVTMPWQFHVS